MRVIGSGDMFGNYIHWRAGVSERGTAGWTNSHLETGRL
jgi:hypothetical protein